MDIKKMKQCAPLLPEPGNIIALDLIAEVERLLAMLEARNKFDKIKPQDEHQAAIERSQEYGVEP